MTDRDQQVHIVRTELANAGATLQSRLPLGRNSVVRWQIQLAEDIVSALNEESDEFRDRKLFR